MADHYHLDCSSGIAGDMFLGACLDLGMPLDVLHETVARLHLPNVSVESRKASRGGFVGTRFRVLVDGKPLEGPDPEEHHHHHHHDHDHHHHHHGHSRDLAAIRELIQVSDLAELVDEYVDFPSMVLDGTGYGLGKKDLPDRPNAVRLLRGRGREVRAEVMIVECEVDDLPGEGFGFLMERLLEAGALEVYFTPVQMKKNRPGTLITMLCRRHQLEGLAGVLLMESGSLGCRYSSAARFEAEREITEVEPAFGTVRVKRARLNGRPLAAAPEFDDCRRLALASGVPWRDVYRAALAAAGQ
jgi:uncharacterized protein (DUF111 family)